MDSKLAFDERMNFSDRLKESLNALGLSTTPSAFVRAYNARADGAAVSVHAARKWLVGEAIPTHEKLVVLSIWLGVSATWLRFGETGNNAPIVEVVPEANLTTPALALMNDILSLPPAAQTIIREIVDAFLRHATQHRNVE